MRTDRDAQRATTVGAAAVPGRALIPLSELQNTSISAPGSSISTMGELVSLIQEMPLLLPPDQGYVMIMEQGALHIYGKDHGIGEFELTAMTSMSRRGDASVMKIDLSDQTLELYVHDKKFSGKAGGRESNQAASRTTAPFRERRRAPSCASSRRRGE